MKNANTITREENDTLDNIGIEISKVGVGAVTITSALIGCWSVACLISGMISNNGPSGLVSSFISAITG